MWVKEFKFNGTIKDQTNKSKLVTVEENVRSSPQSTFRQIIYVKKTCQSTEIRY